MGIHYRKNTKPFSGKATKKQVTLIMDLCRELKIPTLKNLHHLNTKEASQKIKILKQKKNGWNKDIKVYYDKSVIKPK